MFRWLVVGHLKTLLLLVVCRLLGKGVKVSYLGVQRTTHS